MTSIISEGIAKWLTRERVILNDDQQLYSYAVHSLFLGLLPVVIAVALGVFFGILYESFLMLLPFMLLRKFSGGFHFDSAKLCIVCSTVLIALALGLVKFLLSGRFLIPLLICVILSAISIFANSPIESSARKLSAKERTVFRLIARILVTVILLMFLLLFFLGSNSAIPIGVGLVIAAFLQLPCILGKLRKKQNCQEQYTI